MKTIKKMLKIITTLMVILWVPLTASAADMWAETPDLNNNDKAPTVVADSSTFIFNSPEVNMWAETPDLLTEREEHGVYIDTESRLVNNYNHAMYVETPDLDTTPAAPRVKRVESILIVKEE